MYLLFGILAVICIYFKLSKLYNFWTDRGIKQRKQLDVCGDFGVLLGKKSIADTVKGLYDEFHEERYVGFYQLFLPILMVRDPELIKRITIKDFDYFVDHRQFVPEGIEPLWSNNLFSLKGNKWRHMRATLTPTFTSSKMKMLHQLICECTLNFTKHFSEERDAVITLNFKDVSTRFTSDMIASVVFCVKCDSLKDRKNEFYLRGLEATSIFRGFWKTLKFIILSTIPKLGKFLRLSLFNSEVREFFMRIVKENIRMREELKVERQDMLHLLLEARKGKLKVEENEELVDNGFAAAKEAKVTFTNRNFKSMITDEDIAAQAMVFFFGAFDTISILICFMAYELSVNTDVQNKLRGEIVEVFGKFGENLHYDEIMKLKYMDMVISETLRKWPPAPFLERACVKPYTIEPESLTEKPVHIKEGDIVNIPVSGLHHDPKYYERPEEFDPERFNDQNKSKVNPFAYLPFGMGPRNCIGSKFALLVTKVFFFYLLYKFELVTVKKSQVPLKLKKYSFTPDAEKGFWIGLKHRSIGEDIIQANN